MSIAIGALIGFGQLPTAVVGLAATVLDTGGLPWFLIATWSDRGMWDENWGK